MESATPLDILCESRIVAIIRLSDLSIADELTAALLDGGIRAIEFTLTNRDALSVVRRQRQHLDPFKRGDALLGIGSVRSLSDAQQAIDAGAQFIVAPVLQIPVVDTCKRQSVCVIPGAYTPTEIVAAVDAGADLVKVFPARQLGPRYIQDVLAPLPDLRLVPTGGIDLTNLCDYLQAGAAAVGIGGQFLDPAALKARNWSAITDSARQYVTRVGTCLPGRWQPRTSPP
jgi:2-dehydro-3-deoxyphosphogluconate aldolase/(4S)-4-hydroxy-2-oxoglutarate aldolase